MTKHEAMDRATELAREINQQCIGEDATVIALALKMYERIHVGAQKHEIKDQIEELWTFLRQVCDDSAARNGIFPGGS